MLVYFGKAELQIILILAFQGSRIPIWPVHNVDELKIEMVRKARKEAQEGANGNPPAAIRAWMIQRVGTAPTLYRGCAAR
ncbi:hypothetical protein D9756_006908 [Leucocoprinus leucothites]|uniref:Uncharacterized protein n=1 Tax=Leucocoprinus leucothites TaxID=201217 RepID=A0A8H5D6U5_9AGAR|nr:hypothetical protein D9756_006908 [Leucoagaricus leucothites]